MRRSKKVTLKEVAAHSGVSPATACRVLGNNGYPVSPEIRDKVLDSARELGYLLNPAANLSREVAVMIPTVGNLFYSSLIAGIEGVLSKENYQIIFYDTDHAQSYEDCEFILQSTIAKGVRGIIAASASMFEVLQQYAPSLKEKGIAVTLADCPVSSRQYNSIFYDYKKGARLGTEFLLAKGHRRILYAGMPLERESRRLRVAGFQEAIKRAGLPLDGSILTYQGEKCHDNQQIDAGEELAERILQMEQKPTAIFAMNDMVAFGLFRCFRRHGIRIPEDFSILGFDDSPFCDTVSPGLTSVKVHSEQMGRMAAMLLLDTFRGTGTNAVQLSIEPCIVERDTIYDFNHSFEH